MATAEKKILEKDILRDIGEWLNSSHYFFWRSNNIPAFSSNRDGSLRFRSMPKFSKKGIPDFCLISNGRFIGIEVKRPGSDLRPDQKVFQALLEAHGGLYCKAESTYEVINFFATHKIV